MRFIYWGSRAPKYAAAPAQAATGSVVGLRHEFVFSGNGELNFAGKRLPRLWFLWRGGEKFLRREFRACLQCANPITSLLLVSELNQLSALAWLAQLAQVRS